MVGTRYDGPLPTTAGDYAIFLRMVRKNIPFAPTTICDCCWSDVAGENVGAAVCDDPGFDEQRGQKFGVLRVLPGASPEQPPPEDPPEGSLSDSSTCRY
jgi:hypothetical protein